MSAIVFAVPDRQALTSAMAHPTLESGAILLAHPVRKGEGGEWRLLVKECHVATGNDYVERTPENVRLAPEFCLPLEKKAKLENLSLIYCHSHVHHGRPRFSGIDDRTEVELRTYLDQRQIFCPAAALLMSHDAMVARVLGSQEPIRIIENGSALLYIDVSQKGESLAARHDRQIRAFGADGQQRLSQMSVAIIGLGGTGSLVAQQLAHLGVGEFLLFDQDCIEETNLNRVVGAMASDIDRAKVDVAADMIARIQGETRIHKYPIDVTAGGASVPISAADFIFGCTDTHASRHWMNQFSYQYRIPAIDMGVAIANSGEDLLLAGHVKMLAPGLSCLWCARHLDSKQIWNELRSEAERAADPYFVGGTGVSQPAVISLNSTVASLAVTMFLSAVTGIPSAPRYILYDGNRGRVNQALVEADPACVFCGSNSTAGWGADAPLPEHAHG